MNWASLQVSEWKKNNSTENEYVTFVIFLSEDIVKTNNLLLDQK